MAVVKKEYVEKPREKRPKKSREEKDAATPFILAAERTEPVRDLGEALILIFGERKIGKTSLANLFPKALTLAFEVGYKGLRLYKNDMESWKTARAALRALKKDKTYKTIVIDTADIAYKFCEAHVNDENGVEDPGDLPYGKGWRAIRKEFEGWLNALAKTGKGVIILSHAGDQDITTRDGETYSRLMPTMAKQAREIIEGMVDVWGCYQYAGKRRVLTILGDEDVSAGHRFVDQFRTPDGRRLRRISMGKSAEQGYKNLVAAFKNTWVPPNESYIDQSEEEVAPKKSAAKIRLKR